jgi:hypothetical protein
VVAPTCVNLVPCWLGPVATSIDYVVAHMGFMGSHKFSSFDGHRVGLYLTSLHGCTTGWCAGHPWMPIKVITWKMALG